MPRYFLELAYKGTRYSGFQVQENAHTVQAETEKALAVLLGSVILTGSSRTDAGVHALQNFFHFDVPEVVETYRGIEHHAGFVYKMNAILPPDITVKNLYRVADDAHCRFDAQERGYRYYIYNRKNPFLEDRAYYFPYTVDLTLMNQAAALLLEYNDFTSFSKRNTQVKSYLCRISHSVWNPNADGFVYEVRANRFLRGMVRALTATMLKLGRGHITIEGFRAIIEARDCTKASFAVPAKGLFLETVRYPHSMFFA